MTAPATISGALEALRHGEVSSAELVDRAIAVTEAVDPLCGCFTHRLDDQARAAARAADETRQAGRTLGPLHGIPIGIKDLLTTRDAPTTAQSRVPTPYRSRATDAVAVARLRAAGAIITGKLTMMEFGLGAPDPDGPFPVPRNPWQLEHWAGGSSSGSASAVATGAVLGALGSDTAGSIRMPAAFCGVTGLKPTFGRVPVTGTVPLAPGLDVVGPIARTARDCAVLLSVLAGRHPADPAGRPEPPQDYVGALTGDLAGVRVGYCALSEAAAGQADPALEPAFTAFLGELEAAGAQLVAVSLPLYDEASVATLVAMIGEAFALHRRALQEHWSDYAAGTRAMLANATFFSAAEYVQAQRVRVAAQQALARLYRQVDLIATPTASAAAPSLDRLLAAPAGLGGSGFGPVHTPYWNAVGNPVISVPIGFTGAGLPLGAQLAGRPLAESSVLRAADAYQRRTSWHRRTPGIVAHAATDGDLSDSTHRPAPSRGSAGLPAGAA